MKQWYPSLRSLTREEIFDAVDDPQWQRFRLSLKGLPTELKLDKLHKYLFNGCEYGTFNDRTIRVANYLAALRRAGLLNSQNGVIR
jgi:hypothetical protein